MSESELKKRIEKHVKQATIIVETANKEKEKRNKEFKQFVPDSDPIKLVDDGLFHIGQCYDIWVAETVQCIKCGSKEFNVGSGTHFTVIRCPKCKWEWIVHDG